MKNHLTMLLIAILSLSLVGGISKALAQNPASLDLSFDPGVGISEGAPDLRIFTTAVQSDGKIIIGGDFTMCDNVSRNYIARLNADGSLDTSFDPGEGAGGNYNYVHATAIQSDGKIIIGGRFTSFDGTLRSRIARLNTDGSLDETFNPGSGVTGGSNSTAVFAIDLQSDGKIMIGGDFTSYNGTARNRIARLNADGSLDATFSPSSGADGIVETISVLSSGKMIIGGSFWYYNGTARNRIAQLNANGSLDATFNPGTGANGDVRGIAIQSDGKIIISGYFLTYNGTSQRRIARLNANGALDATFDAGTGSNSAVNTTAIQSDGKIIIGGSFWEYNGVDRNGIARLNTDGSLDETFDSGLGTNYATVFTSAIQTDAKIILAGSFIAYNDTARNYIARLNGDGAPPVSIGGIGTYSTDVEAYPNPTNGSFNLILAQMEGIVNAKVFDAQGREVWANTIVANGSRSQHGIDLTNQAIGIYTLQLHTAQGTLTRKLVKN